MLLEALRSPPVVMLLTDFGVTAAVELDREPRLGAIEVEDESADRVLASESDAETGIAEASPEDGFGIGLTVAEFAGEGREGSAIFSHSL